MTSEIIQDGCRIPSENVIGKILVVFLLLLWTGIGTFMFKYIGFDKFYALMFTLSIPMFILLISLVYPKIQKEE